MTDRHIVTMINCPFHDDKTPSCAIYSDGRYHCFGAKCTKPNGRVADIPKDIFSFDENKVAKNSKSRYVIVSRDVKIANLENYKLIDTTRTTFWMVRGLHGQSGGGLKLLQKHGVLQNFDEVYDYWLPTYDVFGVNTGGCLRTTTKKLAIAKVKLCGHPVFGYPKYSFTKGKDGIKKVLLIVESLIDAYTMEHHAMYRYPILSSQIRIDYLSLLGTSISPTKKAVVNMVHGMHHYDCIIIAFDEDATLKADILALELKPYMEDTRIEVHASIKNFYEMCNLENITEELYIFLNK